MAEDLQKKIKEWLQKQGYPLELKCAKVFQDAGFGVALGEYYEDLKSSKLREIDIISTKHFRGAKDKEDKYEIVLRFLVQCKVSKEKPWLLFRPTNDYPSHPELGSATFGNPAYHLFTNLYEIKDLPKEGFFRGRSFTAYGVTTALRNRSKDTKSKDTTQPKSEDAASNKDLAYEALSSVTSAFHGWKPTSEGLLALSHLQEVQEVRITVPLVIMEGKAFSARLSEGEIVVEPVTTARINWKGDASKGGTTIDFVTSDVLQDYLTEINREIGIVVKVCAENPEYLKEETIDLSSYRTKER